MNSLFSFFSIARPQLLLLAIPVVPVALLMAYKFRRLEKSLSSLISSSRTDFSRLRRSFFLRTFLRCLAWVSAVLAISGISWGTRQYPVQKSGCAVSFVFDISYSMNALDVDDGRLTRLDAVKIYVRDLLSLMDGTSVSAVLCKGDGILAVPLTEDLTPILSLVDALSPSLMTASGSSLGKGIECAVSSFPQNSSQSNMIFVFTDGDETDDSLHSALSAAGRFQIPVTIVGFGSEDGVEVLSGDGKTPVRTFLMENKMKNLADNVNKNVRKLFPKSDFIRYVRSSSHGSAVSLLNQIDRTSESFSYEIRTVSRHDFFIVFSLIFFVLSFIISEIDLASLRARFSRMVSFVSVSLVFTFVSCSSPRTQVLKGSIDYKNAKYRSAIVDFVSVLNDSPDASVRDYAVFGLASTYISLEEYDVALEKLSQIVPEKNGDEYKDKNLASAVFYNEGVIFVRKGDFSKASALFKDAILASPENLDAKINLELCEQRLSMAKKKSGATEMKSVVESMDVHVDPKTAALFKLIRENEQNQWKKMDSKEEEKKNELDY
ncbi:MAG: VWA domain-containing protein [Treponema sp.]|nr:VWA domain-containing protein [Treponema sp.]